MRRVVAASLLLGGLAGGCAPPPSSAVSEAPIVNGVFETGYPAVYFILHQTRRGGASCSAALISPHVVLTARHCVVNVAGDAADPPDRFSVFRGSDRSTFGPGRYGYQVERVEIIPGSSANINNGRAEDVALLILSEAAAEMPIPVARDTRPDTLVGMTGVAVGFGQQPNGDSGVKMRGMAPVMDTSGGIIYVDPTVCSGDSGGPLLGPDGRIYGVASFIYSTTMSEPVCGTAPGAYNEVYRHLEWINTQIESTGDACFPNPEVCDGADNDCDGDIDEFCDPLGSSCESGASCVGGVCALTSVGSICTQACDFTRPNAGCGDGFFCTGTPGTCDGYCVPGSVGTTPLEAACEADTDCESGVCRDPGDGSRRCLNPCRADSGNCIAGQVCLAAEGACAVCVPSAIFPMEHGLGEVCAQDDQCRSGTCTVRNGLGECTTGCRAGRCDANFVCELGRCVERRSLTTGGICSSAVDCLRGGLCASEGDRRFCSASCSASLPCPADFECTEQLGVSVCTPMAGLVGDACDADAACVTGMCRAHPTSGRRVCTSACSPELHCSVGFTCDRMSDASRGCFQAQASAPPAPPSGCHCAALRPGAPSLLSLGLGSLALGTFALKRRRRASRRC